MLLSLAWGASVTPAAAEEARAAGAVPEAPLRLASFPGAMGFGAGASGGRGGVVKKVTNLDDDGVGSFRWAVSGDEPKTVVFDASGIIRVKSTISVGKNTTIAGQTSPAGITFYNFDRPSPSKDGQNGKLDLSDNTIVRHIRVRGSHWAGEGLQALGQHEDLILDHVSVAWSGDEIAAFTKGVRNLTIQWCTFEEPLAGWHDKENHNYGPKLTGASPSNGNISVYFSLITHAIRRCPSMDFGGEYVGDVRGNVLYNCMSGFKVEHGSRQEPGASHLGAYNLISNYYKPGPQTGRAYGKNTPMILMLRKPIRLHVAGHCDAQSPEASLREMLYTKGTEGELLKRSLVEAPVPVSVPHPSPTISAQTAYRVVLAQAGAWPRDATTKRVIRDVANGTGSFLHMTRSGGKLGYVLWKDDAGNDWPQTAPPKDRDGDGMPDDWETRKGLDKDKPDHNGTNLSEAGYTNIEIYINGLVKEWASVQPQAREVPNQDK